MSKKISEKYNELIYNGYKELINDSVSITKIASILNERWGTNFAESSMRNRYENMERFGGYFVEDDEVYQDRLFNLAKQDLSLKKQRKVLVKERGMVEGIIKEVAEKDMVKELISEIMKRPCEHNLTLKVRNAQEANEAQVYTYGDVHYGYKNDEEYAVYNPQIAKNRLQTVYEQIYQDVVQNGYKGITIVDMADQIEGSALRVSQLVRIAMSMTEQAKDYADITIGLIEWLSKMLPDVQIVFLMISEDNHAQLRLFNTKRDDLPENLALLITNQVKTFIDTSHKFGAMKNVEFHSADELLVDFGEGYKAVFAHGHQYGRKDNILQLVEHRHEDVVALYVSAHWHRFSIKHKDVKLGTQQAMVFIPSVVGDTDFSKRLFVSSFPGFAKITIDLRSQIANAKVFRI